MYLIWIVMACLLGYVISAVFAGILKLPRNIFLLFYIPLTLIFFIAFILMNSIDIKKLFIHNWYWGLLGALISEAFVIKNVLSQPASGRNKGGAFLLDVIWPGCTYGLTDSLLLSVLPVIAVQYQLFEAGWKWGLMGKIGFGAIALAASMLVTVAYHIGYPEFRGKKVVWPMIGNGILTLAYLLTMNPLAAILPHMAMHIAAMVHGRETTGQVPPHYDDK